MQKPARLGAIVLALLIAITPAASNAPLLNAQTEQVETLFDLKQSAVSTPAGLRPDQIRKAYGFDQIVNKGKGQIIGIVDSFDHPAIEQDLATFNAMFGLSPCTTANGCFRKIYADGKKPPANALWALEIALDVEWAHAIAPEAKILLVEAGSDQLSSLLKAVDVAIKRGATVISMSWGLGEIPNQLIYDGHFVGANVTFFAASGDSGHGTMYPAASPYVMGVGGTTLKLDKDSNYSGEVAWSGSGGGLSSLEPEPIYQITYPIPNNPLHQRGIPDVAYNANPHSGVAVYDSIPLQGVSGWWEVGGTSVGAPQWAALFAIANSVRAGSGKPALTGKHGDLYDLAKANPGLFNDIVKGKNDKCGELCKAAPGYDYITGLGTPRANLLIPALNF